MSSMPLLTAVLLTAVGLIASFFAALVAAASLVPPSSIRKAWYYVVGSVSTLGINYAVLYVWHEVLHIDVSVETLVIATTVISVIEIIAIRIAVVSKYV